MCLLGIFNNEFYFYNLSKGLEKIRKTDILWDCKSLA